MGKSSMKNQAVTVGPGIPDPRAGLPRVQIQDAGDPYIPDQHLKDGTVCTGCGAVYHHQRWTLDERLRDTLVAAGTPHETRCPGCQIIKDRLPQGIVTLHGDYWPQHREDITNLVKNEETRARSTNPIERVMDMREENGCLVIETTTEKLAQRIGRSIHNAHKGDVEYKWSDGNQLVRVEWAREMNGK